jgi:hypothetical protein
MCVAMIGMARSYLRAGTYRIDRIGRMELLGQIAPPKRHGYSEQDARYDIVLASR